MVLVKQVFVLAAVFGLASAHANGIQHRRSFGRRQGGSGNDTKDATTKDGDSKGDSSLTSSLLPAVSLPSDVLDTKSSTTESSTETNTKESTTSSDETKTTPTSTPTDDPTTTSSPTSSDTNTDSKTTTTTTDGPTKTPDDPLSSILSSILDPITGTPTTTTDDPTTTPTSTPTDPTSTPTDPTSSSDSDSSSSSSSDPTVSLPITISDLPTISLPITITTPTDSPTDSPTGSPTDSPTESPTDPPTISNPVTDPPVTDPPVTDPPVTDPPVTDPPVTDPPITTPPPNGTVIVDPPTITQDPPTITEQPTDPSPSPNTTVISFPQGTDGSTVIDTSTEVATTTVYSVTIASDFDFFSATTLALAPEPTTTTAPTLSDPDAATAAPSAATTLLVAPLPSDVPGRVYPPSDPDPEKVADKTLVSLLLDTGRLPWKYVVDHDNASTQIFALMPGIVDGAVGITDTNDQTQTLYLQAFVPADYTGPSDLEKVGTLTFLYVKTDAVNDLASQIKVKTSPFYTGPSDPMSKALANLVVASYNILSVSDPNSDGSGTTSNASVSGGSSKTREDAIIGVVSALGGVALLVLLFLLYRAYKRRQQLANRRLSDPPNTYIGERTPGRDFDQDSVGGQRRRSFYFAEDSLRGAGQESQSSGGQAGSSGWVLFGQDGQGRVQEDEYWDYSRSQGQQMSQRRPVAGGNISAPILRGSTMNW